MRGAANVRRMNSAALLVCATTLLLTGCVARQHRNAPAIHLQQLTGSTYLVPGRPVVNEGDRQITAVYLGKLESAGEASCAVHGSIFSLTPPAKSAMNSWAMTSPSMHGWQALQTNVDFRSEWLGFLRALAALQERGCFHAGWSFLQAQQKIAEAIPLPSDDALVFAYSFTGAEAINLFPDMQVQVEHSVYVTQDGQKELQSGEGYYRVVASGSGVALRRTRIVTLHQTSTQPEIFHLDRLTRGASMLRLFLQSVATGDVRRQSILLASSSVAALAIATQRVQSPGANGCTDVVSPEVKCIAFPSAVSLLLACRVNGTIEYRAPGTALSQLLDEKRANVASVTMKRRQADGSYAPVLFPFTQDATAHVILHNGDEVVTH